MDVPPLYRTSPRLQRQRQVVFQVLDPVQLLDLAGPAQVFDIAASLEAPYTLHFCLCCPRCAPDRGCGYRSWSHPPVGPDDLVSVAGVVGLEEKRTQTLLAEQARSWLIAASQAGARIASICGGAFALAEAGLLTGRRYQLVTG